MTQKGYIVRLPTAERVRLKETVEESGAREYRLRHARILLGVDADGPNWTDEQAAEACRCHKNTVRNVRRRFVGQGLTAALERRKQARPSRRPALDADGEAQLIALARCEPPPGRGRWTLELLANRLVELGVVDVISPQTVRRTLKRAGCRLTAKPLGRYVSDIAPE